MKVRKAVIPAAGLGTRVLPASKAIPKEMLPIVDKPAIQYIVEEAVAAGITEILIITNRGKVAIEDHFDHSFELEAGLRKNPEKAEILKSVEAAANLANITFIRQKETGGLGHAVLKAKQFIGDEPFAVLYGDDVILGEDPCIGQLCRAYEEYGKGVVGIKEVTAQQIKKYSSMKVSPLKDNLYEITDMIEKPKTDADIFSLFSILGRCVLPAEIFDILLNTPKGAGNELQLTDAMKTLSQTKGMVGVDFTGTRYDMGNKFGILKANIDVGLSHPETKEELAAYIKEIAKTL
ncbi:MAG: UTP--glucose-1-phosphate uridylyltransferase GalU [Oscillospiraceae bacterium]|nr:UTP--glucose-1-phosphate uridylyltransferase GalU [Candidatus Equicaccousia limihippi]